MFVAFCLKCGISESVKSDDEVQKRYDDMDIYLKFQRKRRIPIKGDGHCLPRAVFRGAKYLNLLPCYEKVSDLLFAVVEEIKTDIASYSAVIKSKESAKEALDTYVREKAYNIDSNIVDVIVVGLANRTSCTIRIHYQQ